MKFEFNFAKKMPEKMPLPETPPGKFDGSELGIFTAITELGEGVESLDELDLKSLNPGDRAFIRTASGSRYLFENLDSGKLVMYNKPKDAPEDAVWGAPQTVHTGQTFLAKKGEALTLLLVAGGGMTRQTTTSVDSIEVHRHGSTHG